MFNLRVTKNLLINSYNIINYRNVHTPVMVNEVINFLSPEQNGIFIDMTFGSGGHSNALLQKSNSKIKLICIDRDPNAYTNAVELSKKYPEQILPFCGKFSELPQILGSLGLKRNCIDGFLIDCGCSSEQLDIADRGFSLSKNGPLDMRMDAHRFPNSPTALDILKKADEIDLYKIFKIYGEEKLAKKISRALIESRYTFRELKTTQDLADFVSEVSSEKRLDKLQRHSHPATKIFQALRIFVNNELNELNYAMDLIGWYLKVGGRFVGLSFHSLEDRIVKRHLSGRSEMLLSSSKVPSSHSSHALTHEKSVIDHVFTGSNNCQWLPLNKHVLTPSQEEMEINPRSRSAKLRAAIKIK